VPEKEENEWRHKKKLEGFLSSVQLPGGFGNFFEHLNFPLPSLFGNHFEF
jgi:hypothetical protein